MRFCQLRNPWGGHEWTGAWCDKDPRWTPALKQEVGQADKEDGMFWMSIDDFARSFDNITFVDMVPLALSPSFLSLLPLRPSSPSFLSLFPLPL